MLAGLSGWEWALLGIAGYVAAMALVRLMIRRRDGLLAEFREQMRQEQARKKAEERKQQQSARRSKAA